MAASTLLLLAQHSRSELFRAGFRGQGSGSDDVLLGLLIVATLVAGIWAVSRLLSLRRQRRGYSSPWRLFWALAKAHRLKWSDKWLLRRVARSQGLQQPGRLFLEAELWEEKNLGPRFAADTHRLKTLRAQILGEPPRNPLAEPVLRPAHSASAHSPSAHSNSAPATPLFPCLPSPTLDIPPWTVET